MQMASVYMISLYFKGITQTNSTVGYFAVKNLDFHLTEMVAGHAAELTATKLTLQPMLHVFLPDRAITITIAAVFSRSVVVFLWQV